MAIPLVEIVNPVTGRKGYVAATSRAAQVYKTPPSARAASAARGEKPAANASTEMWRAYGLAHGLPPEQVNEMTRDQLVDHFKSES